METGEQDGEFGECPPDLIGEKPIVITLENCEQWSPGHVSASYKTLAPSSIFLTVSPTFVMQGSTVTLSGQLTPNLPDEKITIYIKTANSPWTAVNIITTDSEGKFKYALNLKEVGICYVRTSWSGNNNYAGTDSPIITVTVLPFYLIIVILVVTPLVISVTIFLVSRHRYKEKGDRSFQLNDFQKL